MWAPTLLSNFIEDTSYLVNHGNSIGILPRSTARPHLQYDTSQTPDVYFSIIPMLFPLTSSLDNFRSHPEYRPHHWCVNSILVNIFCALRDTKVGYLANPRRINKKIICFKVLFKIHQNIGTPVRNGSSKCLLGEWYHCDANILTQPISEKWMSGKLDHQICHAFSNNQQPNHQEHIQGS